MGLIVNAVFLRVDPRGNIKHQQIARAFPEFRRILPDRDGMKIHNTVKGQVIVSQRHPVLQCAEIISERQIACRLHSAEQYLFIVKHFK